jgi:hypothetical protein
MKTCPSALRPLLSVTTTIMVVVPLKAEMLLLLAVTETEAGAPPALPDPVWVPLLKLSLSLSEELQPKLKSTNIKRVTIPGQGNSFCFIFKKNIE